MGASSYTSQMPPPTADFAKLEVPDNLPDSGEAPWFATVVAFVLGSLVLGVVILAGFNLASSLLPEGDSTVAWDGPDFPLEGSPNPLRTLEFDGWEHCEWQSIRFLVVPREVIPAVDSVVPERVRAWHSLYYVRTSARTLPHTQGDFVANAELPADAVASPYTEGKRELWFSPSDAARYAYIVDGHRVERWPRFDGGCD